MTPFPEISIRNLHIWYSKEYNISVPLRFIFLHSRYNYFGHFTPFPHSGCWYTHTLHPWLKFLFFFAIKSTIEITFLLGCFHLYLTYNVWLSCVVFSRALMNLVSYPFPYFVSIFQPLHSTLYSNSALVIKFYELSWISYSVLLDYTPYIYIIWW